MITFSCKKCQKPLEVHTEQDKNNYSLLDDIPFHTAIDVDGTYVHCGGCREEYRMMYNRITERLEVINNAGK